MIRTIATSVETTYSIKGSRFLSYLYPLEERSLIDTCLHGLKKSHPKATHICYAYRLGKESMTEFSTDAGEPSGTAGKPILGILQKHQITEAALFVVRYFGGTKLGVRGLIDAYHAASELAIEQATVLTLTQYIQYSIQLDYSYLSTFQHDLGKHHGKILTSRYSDVVDLEIALLLSSQSWIQDLSKSQTIRHLEEKGILWLADS